MKRTFLCSIAVCLCTLPGWTFGHIVLNDGKSHTIDYAVNDLVWVQNSPEGNPTTLILKDGGIINDLEVSGDCTAYVYGGSTNNWDITSTGNSEIFIYGGSFRDIYAWGGQVTIAGENFNHPYGFVTDLQFNLTGTLASGDGIQSLLCRTVGGDTAAGEVLLVPEPATLLLLGLGGFMLRRRRK